MGSALVTMVVELKNGVVQQLFNTNHLLHLSIIRT